MGEEKFRAHNPRRKVDMYLDHCPSLNLVVEWRPQGRCGVADGPMVRRPGPLPKLRAARLLFSLSPGPLRARTCRDKPTLGLGECHLLYCLAAESLLWSRGEGPRKACKTEGWGGGAPVGAVREGGKNV